MRIRNQTGVGMMEVLVALLLLSLAVLGFAALQLRAVEATAEGGNRIQAMNIARDLAEKIRMNSSNAALRVYQANLADEDKQSASVSSCYSGTCTPATKAAFDVNEAYLKAQSVGMVLNMMDCPGTANGRTCIYVAWNKTDATDNTTSKDGKIACTESQNSTFSYQDNSTCVVMEAF